MKTYVQTSENVEFVDTPEVEQFFNVIEKLNKDLKEAAKTLSTQEVQFYVDSYYRIQDIRKILNNQKYALKKAEKPTEFMDWILSQFTILENNVKKVLDIYSKGQVPVGEWLREVYGIGPVLGAGVLSCFDMEKAPTSGHLLSYAGMTPNSVPRKKGEKLTYNPFVKTLMWKVAHSFEYFKNREDCYYGSLFKNYVDYLSQKNESGGFQERALEIASSIEKSKKFDKTSESYIAYKSGKLAPSHINAMGRRWIVKIFLSHYFDVWYESFYDKKPPEIYVVSQQGHVHKYPIPGWTSKFK